MLRVLLTSIGRRSYLVKYFKDALNNEGQVWGADNSPYAPALQFCDKTLLLPQVNSSNYTDHLLGFCRKNNIDIVVPLIDPELAVLAAHQKQFSQNNIMMVVSPKQTIDIAFDKYRTYEHAKKAGIPVPQTVLTIEEVSQLLAEGTMNWPVIVKPRKGSASISVNICSNETQLKLAYDACPGPMIQEFVAGDEFGYDIFNDPKSKPVSVFCKRKMAMRAGETDKAVSINDKDLINLGLKIAQAFPMFGPADVDVKTGTNGPVLLEINPRFGGGYPCSHLCGANFPAKLIALRKGDSLKPDIGNYPGGIYMFKQDEIVSPSQDNIKKISEQFKSEF